MKQKGSLIKNMLKFSQYLLEIEGRNSLKAGLFPEKAIDIILEPLPNTGFIAAPANKPNKPIIKVNNSSKIKPDKKEEE